MTMDTTHKAAADETDAQKKPKFKLRDLDISQWNRSHGAKLDADYIKTLAADIKANGLVNPIILVWHKKSGRVVIVAGAHRVAALKSIRGEDGVLNEGEYRIIDGLDADDPRCFDISVADNRHQRGMSLYEKAKYVHRVIEELNLDQGRVADAMGLHRPHVNRLEMLAEYWDKLPETVKSDFCIAPYSGSEKQPVLTFSWWYEFASAFQKDGLNDEVRALMEKALAERWSTRQVKDAVQLYTLGGPAPADEQPTVSTEQTPPRTLKPAAILNKAFKTLTKVEELMAEYGVLADVSKLLADAKQILTTRLAELKPAKADKPVKGRKVKSAKAPKGNTPKSDASTGGEQPADTATEPVKRKHGRPRKAAAMPTAAPKVEQPETDAP